MAGDPGLVWASIGLPSAASALDLVSVKAQQIVTGNMLCEADFGGPILDKDRMSPLYGNGAKKWGFSMTSLLEPSF